MASATAGTGAVTKSSHRDQAVRRLRAAARSALTSRERSELVAILSRYKRSGNVLDLTDSLWAVLDTPAKRRLVPLLRAVLPVFDRTEYDMRVRDEDLGDDDNRRDNVVKAHRQLDREYDENDIGQRSVDITFHRPNGYRSAGGHHRPGHDSTDNLPPRHPSNRSFDSVTPISTVRHDADTRIPTSEIRHVTVDRRRVRPDGSTELGFGIRGGAEHGLGIYVSSVDDGSPADVVGLKPGDLILALNGVSFRNVTNSEAVKLIRNTASRLDLEVWYAGRVPGSYETHQEYSWIDIRGRPTSPPLEVNHSERYRASGTRKSGLMLLKDDDERKVNVTVGGSQSLGITVRGGNDFGLGIYISRVDDGSAADFAGLKVGDQILDVNGFSFLDTTHSDAVRCLRSSKRLIMTVKDVGKIPHAMTSYDRTQWISGDDLSQRGSAKPVVEKLTNGRSTSPGSLSLRIGDRPDGSLFTRGVGSQLMLRSSTGQTAQLSIVNERAHRLLSDANDAASLNYYVTTYVSGHVTVEELVVALRKLLSTKRKRSLLKDIRGLILPRDIDNYDRLVQEKSTGLDKEFGSLDSLFRLPDMWTEHSLSKTTSVNSSRMSRGISTGESDSDELSTLRRVIDELTVSSINSDSTSLELQTTKNNRQKPKKFQHLLSSLQSSSNWQPKNENMSLHQVYGEQRRHSDESNVIIPRRPTEPNRQVLNASQSTINILNAASNGRDNVWNNVELQPYFTSVNLMRVNPGSSSKTILDNRLTTASNSVSTQTDSDHIDIDQTKTTSSTANKQANNLSWTIRWRQQQLASAGVEASSSMQQLWSDSNYRTTKKLVSSSSFDESLPETTTVTLNHHQHDVSDTTSPFDGRSIQDNDDNAALSSASVQLMYSQQQQSTQTTQWQSSTSKSTNNRTKDQSLATVDSAVYAVPWKPPPRPETNGVGRDLDVLNERYGRAAQRHPMKPRRTTNGGIRVGQSRPSAATSGGSRPKIPLEYMSGTAQQTSTVDTPETDDDLGFDDVINIARANGYGLIGDQNGKDDEMKTSPSNHRSDVILPPPDYFSDTGLNDFRDAHPSQMNGHVKATHSGQEVSSLANMNAANEAVYSEVVDVVRSAASSSENWDWKSSRDNGRGTLRSSESNVHLDSSQSNGTQTHYAVIDFTEGEKKRPPADDIEPLIVRVNKSKPILGIAIEGGANTKVPLPRIARVQVNGSAAESELRVGQTIVEVNGRSLVGLRHIDCARAIAQAFRDKSQSYLVFVVRNADEGFVV